MRIKVAVVALITVLVSLVVGHSLIRAQTLTQSNATISINNLGTTGFSLWTNVLHNIP